MSPSILTNGHMSCGSRFPPKRREGVRRIDLKIIASDPDPTTITKAVEALN
jgi:hypothetical protein